jgi:hypothetical protein
VGVLGVAGPGGRTGPLPRRCPQCRPPGGPAGRRSDPRLGRPQASPVEDDLDHIAFPHD